MQPKLVDELSWRVARKGEIYDLKLKLFFVPLGFSLALMEQHGKYDYNLFANGEDVATWQRDTKESLPQIKVFAEGQFEHYAVMMGY